MEYNRIGIEFHTSENHWNLTMRNRQLGLTHDDHDHLIIVTINTSNIRKGGKTTKLKFSRVYFQYIEKLTIEATIWWILFFGTFSCPLEQHNETLQFWLNTLARHQAGKPTTYPSYQLGNYNTLQIFWDLFCTTVTHCVKPPFLSKNSVLWKLKNFDFSHWN